MFQRMKRPTNLSLLCASLVNVSVVSLGHLVALAISPAYPLAAFPHCSEIDLRVKSLFGGEPGNSLSPPFSFTIMQFSSASGRAGRCPRVDTHHFCRRLSIR